MNAALRELIALSVLLGFSLYLCPEGGVKLVLTALCAALLGISVLRPFAEFDYDTLALQNAKLRDTEQRITQDAEQAVQTLNRLYVEDEYASYVMNRAAQLGIEGLRAEIEVEWAYEGLWIPCAARLSGAPEPEDRAALSRILRDELGIPAERQVWCEDG